MPSAAYAREPVASRLDCRHHHRLPDLVADRACPSLFHTREQKNGLLESSGSLAEQDGTDAVEDGADAQPHGAAWLRLRPALERQPRLRRVPRRDVAAPGGGAARVPRVPRPPAPRQGQGGVRRLHGPAAPASDPAQRPAAKPPELKAFPAGARSRSSPLFEHDLRARSAFVARENRYTLFRIMLEVRLSRNAPDLTAME